jgi:hypothetical protein
MPCADCGREVWVSPASEADMAEAAAPGDVIVRLCPDCALASARAAAADGEPVRYVAMPRTIRAVAEEWRLRSTEPPV